MDVYLTLLSPVIWIRVYLFIELLSGNLHQPPLGWEMIVHERSCMDHVTDFGSSDHESMSGPLLDEH